MKKNPFKKINATDILRKAFLFVEEYFKSCKCKRVNSLKSMDYKIPAYLRLIKKIPKRYNILTAFRFFCITFPTIKWFLKG